MNSPGFPDILIETQYFPCISRVFQLMHSKTIHLESKEHYQKRTFRNRCCLGSFRGVMELSVPLQKGKNNKQPIREVRIAYQTDWPSHHWKTIQTNYGSTAYFIHYAESVKTLIFSEKEYLFDLNKDILNFIQTTLQQNWDIHLTDTYFVIPPEGIHDLRSATGLKNYHSWQMPPYYQLFSHRRGFLTNLSFLDLLFHMGPVAYQYLMNPKIRNEEAD